MNQLLSICSGCLAVPVEYWGITPPFFCPAVLLNPRSTTVQLPRSRPFGATSPRPDRPQYQMPAAERQQREPAMKDTDQHQHQLAERQRPSKSPAIHSRKGSILSAPYTAIEDGTNATLRRCPSLSGISTSSEHNGGSRRQIQATERQRQSVI